MKKIIFSFIGLCFSLVASAEPVGRESALYTAQSYMLAKGKTVEAIPASASNSSRRKSSGVGNEECEPYYYVFNSGGNNGYVIVSGDDRTEPILGYVDQGSFDPDNIPENMRSWLQSYADQIKYIRDNNLQPGSPELKRRNKVRGTKHSVAELLTTRWNQGSPYNITCPKYYKEEDGTQHYPATGCTATAMAQVMYFYRHPEKTKTIIPAHSNTYTYTDKATGEKKSATVTTKAIPRNTVIDWENMRDTYSWIDINHANAQDTAVANLMLYCGQSVKMGWGPSSGANFSAEAYIKYFGYDNSCYVGERRDYSIDDWFDMLYNEIEQGYPVLFSGFSSGGGHAFVLDGFDGENLFHLNWGWGGGSNGWFLVSILNPGDTSGIGASSSSDGYSMSQRALFNLRLPDNNNADTYLFIKDVSTTNYTIKATFENRTGNTGNFNTAIVRYNDEGELVVVGSQQSISKMEANATATKSFVMKDKLPEGTYRLSPASKDSRGKVWKAKYNMRNHYIEAVVDASGNVTLTPVDISNGNSISIDTIVFPGLRVVGQEQEVKVTFRNNGNEYFKEIHLFASKTQDKVYTENRSMVAVRKDETVDVSYFFTPEETGTYNLWFCTSNNGSGLVGSGTMEVIEESQADKANLNVSSYTITNTVSGVVYGNRLIGKATIKNNKSTDFHGLIRLQIWNQPNSSGSAWGGSSHTYDVNILAGKIASVEFEFDNLSENNKYYISASYVNQGGSLGNGGVWDLGGWEMKSGLATWKNDGTVSGMAYRTSITAAASLCGIYANCTGTIRRLVPNKNPNTFYAFAPDMEVPESIDTCNAVSGSHAKHIDLVNDRPFYNPVSFNADTASFTYTFPETEEGTGWHAVTMPFEVDSIFVDDIYVALDDETKHFWIYEFAAQGDNGEIIFAPATVLRGNTPYIMAADSKMAGRSIVFRSHDVPFFKTGSDKMVVTSQDYKFHGITYAPMIKDCYILNEEGTAFEYSATNKAITALNSYFTTNLPEELRLPSIVLPEIPVSPGRKLTLDETSQEAVVAGLYDQLTLKLTLETGLNAVCLPFQVEDVAAVFGQEARAYNFCGFVNGEFDFLITNSLEAGQPYVIYVPEANTEDFVLTDIKISPADTEAGFTKYSNTSFCGTYNPIPASQGSTNICLKLTTDGKITQITGDESILGFRAYFEIPEQAYIAMMENPDGIVLNLYDDPTGINVVRIQGPSDNNQAVFNLAGQMVGGRWSDARFPKGLYIVNKKKVLK